MPRRSSQSHVASVIHITDLHLFVDEDGELGTRADRSRLDRFVSGLGFHGLDRASRFEVRSLSRSLRNAIRAESRLVGDESVIAVQTGDVEAYGSIPEADSFRGFKYLENRLLRQLGIPFVGVYGNHDVWPGAFPLFRGSPNHDHQKDQLSKATSIAGPLPPSEAVRFEVGADGFAIGIVPLSTVSSSRRSGGVFAEGELSPHPTSAEDPRVLLRRLRLRDDEFGIAIAHHPVHEFLKLDGSEKGFGRLSDAEEVADLLQQARVRLLLAGHRHELDPPFQTHQSPEDNRQPPLSGMAQLAAVSPTVSASGKALADTVRKGLCVYRIILDSATLRVTVDRAIYPGGLGSSTPTIETSLLRDIPFQ